MILQLEDLNSNFFQWRRRPCHSTWLLVALLPMSTDPTRGYFSLLATGDITPRDSNRPYNQRYCIIIGKMGDPIAIHSKPVVAVDIDEVLAQFIPSLATFHNEVYGGTALTSESFVSYEFHHVWGGTKEECSHKVSVYCAISLFCFFMYPLFRWINSSCPPIFEKMSHQCQKRLRIWLS